MLGFAMQKAENPELLKHRTPKGGRNKEFNKHLQGHSYMCTGAPGAGGTLAGAFGGLADRFKALRECS